MLIISHLSFPEDPNYTFLWTLYLPSANIYNTIQSWLKPIEVQRLASLNALPYPLSFVSQTWCEPNLWSVLLHSCQPVASGIIRSGWKPGGFSDIIDQWATYSDWSKLSLRILHNRWHECIQPLKHQISTNHRIVLIYMNLARNVFGDICHRHASGFLWSSGNKRLWRYMRPDPALFVAGLAQWVRCVWDRWQGMFL